MSTRHFECRPERHLKYRSLADWVTLVGASGLSAPDASWSRQPEPARQCDLNQLWFCVLRFCAASGVDFRPREDFQEDLKVQKMP